jgi:2-aminoadipate transaminase
MTDFAYKHLFREGLPAVPPPAPVKPRILMNSGHNAPELIPCEKLAAAADRVIRREGTALARYFSGPRALGHEGLRRVLADMMRKTRGIDVGIERILVTSGSGQAIDLVDWLFLTPGDVVLVEEFTYHGAITRMRREGAELLPVAMDEHGIRVDALESQLDALAARGVKPKFLYTIPTVQNPTGTVLPLERRRALLDLARRHALPIVEDDCYSDVFWAGAAPPALYALAPDQVIYISTLSKTFAPAVRLGYVVADPAVLQQIVQMKRDGGTGLLDQIIVAEYFAEHHDAHLAEIRARLHHKMKVTAEAVRREFGVAAEFTEPDGGIYLWLKLPEAVDGRSFQEAAAREGILYNIGQEWAPRAEDGRNRIRLCFALTTEDEIREGVARLAQLCFEANGVPAFCDNVPRQRPGAIAG